MTTALAAAPDIETSSDAYARRFAGIGGSFMLDRQQALVEAMLRDKRVVTMLDIGGGHGQLSGPLSAAGHQVTVLGSTRDCAARLSCDPRNAAVSFVEGSLIDLPFPSASFDTVTAIRLMAHVEDWRRLIAEMCRVARSSILIDYPVWASSNALSLATFAVKKRIEGDTRRYRTFWGPEIADEIQRHGKCVTMRRRQFVLPMALHRSVGGGPLRTAEALFARTGLTSLIGNPALLRADTRR